LTRATIETQETMGTKTGPPVIDQTRDGRPSGRSTEQEAQARFQTNETPTNKFTSGAFFFFLPTRPNLIATQQL
jgi:hypothetical protein